MLDHYLPEIDYNIVKLLVCRPCVGSLVSYLKFATVCATTEETIGKILADTYQQSRSSGVKPDVSKKNRNECEILRKRTLVIGSNDRPIKNNKKFFDIKTVKSKVKNVICVAQQKAVVYRENPKWRCIHVNYVILRQNIKES
ncbi:hypothetical protein NQ317_004149 [Molorchus minor]|uniref:Uncharacterized protein n=1 Tax=Molorchus minor TaxID=1323400 RepID=A0ABQ9J6I5_9CUCU|nr:hypothetical protein NQ317_004149 [Molorchus minor]